MNAASDRSLGKPDTPVSRTQNEPAGAEAGKEFQPDNGV
jgi:hypothetical protein